VSYYARWHQPVGTRSIVPPAASIRNFGEAELGQPDLAVAAIDGTAGLDVVGRHRMSFVPQRFCDLQGCFEHGARGQDTISF